jgi:hypothetical protein
MSIETELFQNFSLYDIFVMILILDGRFEEKHLKQKAWKTSKICRQGYNRSLVVSNLNGYPLTEKRLLWLLNKTFLPLLYRIITTELKIWMRSF